MAAILHHAGHLEAVLAGIVGGAFSLVVLIFLFLYIKLKPRGNEQINRIGNEISDEAKALFKSQAKYILPHAFLVYAALFMIYSIESRSNDLFDGMRIGGCFIAGIIVSYCTSYIAVATSTDATVRTVSASNMHGISKSFKVAFTAGSAVGHAASGLTLLGISLAYFTMSDRSNDELTFAQEVEPIAEIITGFGLGCSFMSIFTCIRGSLFGASASLGGALARDEIEVDAKKSGIYIAEEVGNHVGNIGGNTAGLVESFALAIVAAVHLSKGDVAKVALPFWLAGAGTGSAAVSFFLVHVRTNSSTLGGNFGLYKGKLIATLLFNGIAAAIHFCFFDFGEEVWNVLGCVIFGQLYGLFIGVFTEGFTVIGRIAKSVANAGITGPISSLLRALAFGSLSSICPVILTVALILSTMYLSGEYGVAIAAVSMLSNLALNVATESFAPIVNNAAALAGITRLEDAYEDAAFLASIGVFSSSSGSGFAVCSSMITSISIAIAFSAKADLDTINIFSPTVLAGLIIGLWLPFLFSAIILFSVHKSSGPILFQARRQLEGIVDKSRSCIDVTSKCSVQEMILPIMYAFMAPLIIGVGFGPLALSGMLTGSIISSMMINTTLVNTASIISSAKNYTESKGDGKASQIYKTCVVTNSFGVALRGIGPSLNAIIKLMSISALTIGPFMQNWNEYSYWYYGFIPLTLVILGTGFMHYYARRKSEEVAWRTNHSRV